MRSSPDVTTSGKNAGGDGIDMHAIGRPFEHLRPGKSGECRLGRRVEHHVATALSGIHDAMLITLPERRCSMCGPTARVQSSTSVRLTSMMKRSSSSDKPTAASSLPGSVTSGLRIESPSAFTSTSMCPNAARLASTARRTSSGFGDVGDGGDHAPPGRRRDLRRRPLDVRRRQSIECDIGTRLGAAAERPAAMRPPKLRL